MTVIRRHPAFAPANDHTISAGAAWTSPPGPDRSAPMDFLDVTGASGTAYRFRRAAAGQLPATAGNLLVVSGVGAKRRYRLCAAARSLNHADAAVRDALTGARGAEVYVRLNIARTTREAEHADIVAGVGPELDLPDLD